MELGDGHVMIYKYDPLFKIRPDIDTHITNFRTSKHWKDSCLSMRQYAQFFSVFIKGKHHKSGIISFEICGAKSG